MDWKLKRKGALFSIIAILLASLFFFVMLPVSDTNILSDVKVAEVKVNTIDSFITTADSYFGSALEVSVPQALNGMNDYMLDHTYINSSVFQCTFEHMALDGVVRDVTANWYLGGKDLKFAMSPGIIDLYDYPDAGFGVSAGNNTQFFIAEHSGAVDQFTIETQYANSDCPQPMYYNMTILLMNELCGGPGRVLDHGTAVHSFNAIQVKKNITINFTNHYNIDRGEKLYFSVLTDWTLGGACFDILVYEMVDDSALPYTNATYLKIKQYNYSRMNEKYINYFGDALKKYAVSNLSINFDYKIRSMKIYQFTPWDVEAHLNMTYYINNPTATWRTEREIVRTISIEGLLDPHFTRGSNGTSNRTIQNSPFYKGIWDLKTSSSNYSSGNFTRFEVFYNNSLYLPSSRAPNYLMRFQNLSNASSCCGIETLLNDSFPNENNLSSVGHLYWTQKPFNCNLGDLFKVTADPYSIYGNFKLDRNSLAYYGYGGGNGNFSEFVC